MTVECHLVIRKGARTYVAELPMTAAELELLAAAGTVGKAVGTKLQRESENLSRGVARMLALPEAPLPADG